MRRVWRRPKRAPALGPTDRHQVCSGLVGTSVSCHQRTWWIDDTRRGKPAQARGRIRCFDFAGLCSSPLDNFRIVARVPPGRCSRIAPRLSDSGEAFLLIWKWPG
jgi:hypothetical protein